MRILTASLVTLSFLATPVLASAHDVKKKTPDLSDLKLPSESEIEQIIEDMPDLNKLMDGMLAIAQDEDIRSSMERVGEKMADKFEKFEDMEMRENGLPDMNLLMGTMLRTFSDEDVMGEMLGIVGELQEAVEENLGDSLLD